MNSWSKAPFVRILIPFIAGLLIYRSGWAVVAHSWILPVFLALITGLAAWFFVFKSLNTYKTRTIQESSLVKSRDYKYTVKQMVYSSMQRIKTRQK